MEIILALNFNSNVVLLLPGSADVPVGMGDVPTRTSALPLRNITNPYLSDC